MTQESDGNIANILAALANVTISESPYYDVFKSLQEEEVDDTIDIEMCSSVPRTSLAQWRAELDKKWLVKSAKSLEGLQVVQGSTDEQFLREALLEFEEIAQAMRGKDIALGLNRLVS